MKYKIFDVRANLWDDDRIIEASSPIQAVRKIYDNVKRVKNGEIVVRCTTGVYCYIGYRKNDNEKKV